MPLTIYSNAAMDDLQTLETRLCITGKWPSCPYRCHIRPLLQAVAMLWHSDSNRDNRHGGFLLLHHPFHGISAYAMCDHAAPIFRNKPKDCSIGGEDSAAIEEATFLTYYGSIVYIIHRRGTFKASKIM